MNFSRNKYFIFNKCNFLNRPAYQDEFIRLEQELKALSIDYVDKFKNLAYLEQQMEEVDQAEQERLDQKQVSLI